MPTARSRRLIQQLEIAIIDDATRKTKRGKAASVSATCTPAGGNAANQQRSTTSYNCTALVEVDAHQSGTLYRYTGTVNPQTGKFSSHFVGAK